MALRSQAIQLVSKSVAKLGLDRAMKALEGSRGLPYIRAINYHDVPRSHAKAFESQIAQICQDYEPVGLSELDGLFAGTWRPQRPGILVTFDDGFWSHYDVASPILEQYGVPGWFMIPVAFIDCSDSKQIDFAERQLLSHQSKPTKSGRLAMTWDQLRNLSKKHVLGCHTWNHTRLASTLSAEQLEQEIPRAKKYLEEKLGQDVRVFTWVGGEEWSYSEAAARAIREAGFSYSFMGNSFPIRAQSNPLQLHRTNIEAWFSEARFQTSMSGLIDIRYAAQRRRVDALTG